MKYIRTALWSTAVRAVIIVVSISLVKTELTRL
jgi:hypothetical protein